MDLQRPFVHLKVMPAAPNARLKAAIGDRGASLGEEIPAFRQHYESNQRSEPTG